MIQANTRICGGTKRDGTQCIEPAKETLDFCWRHDERPEAQEKRSLAGQKGGRGSAAARLKAKEPPPALPEVTLVTLRDVRMLREQTINDLRAGRISLALAKVQLTAARDHSMHILGEEADDVLRQLDEVVAALGLDKPETWNRIAEIYAALGVRIVGRIG